MLLLAYVRRARIPSRETERGLNQWRAGVLALLAAPLAAAQTVYVDTTLRGGCQTYSAETRRCGAGEDRAESTVAAAMGVATPGTRVVIRGGRLFEPLHLLASGTATLPVTVTTHADEVVRIERIDTRDRGEAYGPIWFDQVSHVVVDGRFVVSASVGFGRMVGGGDNVLRNVRFEGTRLGLGSESKRGGFYVTHSHRNRFEGNLFRTGTDSLTLIASDQNVIEGNTFKDAGHTTLALKCSSHNIVRGNSFANSVQKTVEIYDCEARTLAWHGNGRFRADAPRTSATRRNVVEGNRFTQTGRNEGGRLSTSDANGIQYAGQDGILRRNIFVDLAGPAFGMQVYEREAPDNSGNRAYHNVVTGTRCGALTLRDGVVDNRFVNNVFFANTDCLGNGHTQISYRGDLRDGTILTHNVIWSGVPDTQVFDYEFGDDGHTLDAAEHAAFEGVFYNLEMDPGLDQHLRPTAASAVVDAGMFLTRVVADVDAAAMVAVEDVRHFHAGLGIRGELGDLIRFENAAGPVRVVGVDLRSNIVHLDASVTVRAGQGVALAYSGKAPDIGAYELGD